MRLETKAQIAKVTLLLLTVVASLFVLGVLVVVLCTGLQINPFKETTTELLAAAFGGLIGLASVLVLLNVATNVSLIADAKVAELKIEPQAGSVRKWVAGFIVIAVALVAIVFAGTYLSKERYLAVVNKQADDVLNTNRSLLEEMSRLFASGNPADYNRISEISSFLENQRRGLPELTVIYSGKFRDKLAIYKVGSYFPEDHGTTTYEPTYFTCLQNVDCDYLTRFFSGESVAVMRKYTLRDDQFYIYVPFTGKESRFVLLFERRNSYGKIGS
jgi:hypothetical protein